MRSKEEDLTTRYYAAESTIWLIGAFLLYSSFIGLPKDQALPVLGITPKSSQEFHGIVAVLLFAATFYMVIEWKLSSHRAREALGNGIRITVAGLWAIASLWISYPLITQGTQYEIVSPAWYLGFAVLGFLLGNFSFILAIAALVIRSPEESNQLRLPRVPRASFGQFITWGPVVIILLAANYVLHLLSPPEISGIATALVMIVFILTIAEGWVSMFYRRDIDGNRIPVFTRIKQFKSIFDSHDYSHHLIDIGEHVAKELRISSEDSPVNIQKQMQEKYSAKNLKRLTSSYIEQVDEMEVSSYSKVRNSINPDHSKLGIKIVKSNNDGENLRFRLISREDDSVERVVAVSSDVLEKYANEFVDSHPDEENESLLHKATTSAVTRAVFETLADEEGPSLHRLVMFGLGEQVKDALRQEVDVNERAEAGWTPLLYASAQGYPQITRLLLEAGADPDIPNILGITPLMYGARYGNEEVCQILLEYGADMDIQDNEGWTALFLASHFDHTKIVKLLLDSGADTKIKDLKGKNALDIAAMRKNGRIAKMLRQAGKTAKGKP